MESLLLPDASGLQGVGSVARVGAVGPTVHRCT